VPAFCAAINDVCGGHECQKNVWFVQKHLLKRQNFYLLRCSIFEKKT
jgi:hypothetical protein